MLVEHIGMSLEVSRDDGHSSQQTDVGKPNLTESGTTSQACSLDGMKTEARRSLPVFEKLYST